MDKPVISIIIPAYNEENYIGKTLESVKRAKAAFENPAEVEIIVVNNNSTDATEKIAAEHGAKIVFEEKNQIAKARNTGALNSLGKYLLFIDADTLIGEKTISRVVQVLLTGKVIGGGAFIRVDRHLDLRIIVRVVNYILLPLKLAWGAFIFCERQAFEKIGGFDESLFAIEELDFVRRLKRQGKKEKKKFVILRNLKIISSSRKIDYFSRLSLFKTGISIFFNRKRQKNKEDCEVWYPSKKE